MTRLELVTSTMGRVSRGANLSAVSDLVDSSGSPTEASFFSSFPELRSVTRLGADDETRTRDIDLGKVALYQLSYIRLPADRRAGSYLDPAGAFRSAPGSVAWR
jgi:hypothetical protein